MKRRMSFVRIRIIRPRKRMAPMIEPIMIHRRLDDSQSGERTDIISS